MAQYQHIQRYNNFYGFDLRSNDLTFPEKRATYVENVQFTPTGTIEKRKGYQLHAEPGAKFGLFTYNRIDSNGVEQPEILGISNTIQKLLTTTLSVTYSGANAVANFELVYDPATDTFRCRIEVGTSQVLDYSLGLARDVGSPVTVQNLATQINLLAGFSATITGATNTPAACLTITPQVSLISNPISLTAKYWGSINVTPQPGSASPFAGSETNKNSANFENVTSAQVQNCIYFSNGYNAVMKYDGQNAYRAGLPPESGSTAYTVSAVLGAGANVYVYREQFIQIDANGNQIEGNPFSSAQYTGAEPSASSATVTVSNIQAGSGFNTNCAIVNGVQAGVTTITVDNGSGGSHTMKAGDTAYFFDGASSQYVSRTVTSVGATTITISGAAVNVADNAVISNNLRIRILRNKNTGTTPVLFFELVEIPNNSFAGTQTYTDSASDTSLVAEFLEPTTDRSPPVQGKYISAYQNLLVTAGNLTNPNECSFSDIENPEYFPLVANQITVTNLTGDIITAIHPSAESFLIFQNRAIHAVTGDVPNQNFRVDVLTQDVGCAAHASIADVRGGICFLSNVGPRVMVGTRLPKALGPAEDNELNSRIDPLFNSEGLSSQQVLQLKRAVGFNDRINERYLIFIPAESVEGGVRFSNSNSQLVAYDYTRDAWVLWTNIDMTAGVTSIDSDREIYFAERRDAIPSSGATDIKYYMYRFLNTGTYHDYQDFNAAIDFIYKSPWEFMGNTGTLKNFERIKVYSSEVVDAPFVLTVETEKDFIADASISTCTLNFDVAGYGTMPWDTDPWGSPSTTGIKHKLSNGRAISLRVIFSNSENQTNVQITGYELEMALSYAPGFKK